VRYGGAEASPSKERESKVDKGPRAMSTDRQGGAGSLNHEDDGPKNSGGLGVSSQGKSEAEGAWVGNSGLLGLR
jgi:hypothetical protein